MTPPCSQCGSNSVVEDELYTQTQWVCQDCGSVVSEGIFTSLLSDEKHSVAVPYSISTKETTSTCRNLIKGLSRVRSLSRILRLSKDMELAVVRLYEQAYMHPEYVKKKMMKKELLGGACVLTVCRQNNWPIAMGTISMLLETSPTSVGAIYQDLIKILNIQITNRTSFSEMLESYCHEFKLSPSDVPDIFVEPVDRLVQRSTALLELAADVWIVTGRHPLPLFTACVYLAWQSFKPSLRMKCSLNKFCAVARSPNLKDAHVKRQNAATKRVVEIRETLCKLARGLPWLREDTVEPSSVCTLVDDILSYRKTLMLQAMRDFELNEDADEQSAASSEEVHWGKRHAFVPPSAKNAKRPRPNSHEPDVNGDEIISDTEIESYLRSPEEIKLFTDVQKKTLEEKK